MHEGGENVRMNKRVFKSFFLGLFLIFCLSLSSSFAIANVQASWVNRGEGSIYDDGNLGQGLGDLNEDDEPEDPETDEGTNFFIDMVVSVICSIISGAGKFLFSLLDKIGASLDYLIYGRLVTDTPFFTFDLSVGNVYGIVSAAIYSILRAVTIIVLIVIFISKISLSAWKSGQLAKSGLRDAFTGLVASVVMLLLMPNIVDVALFIRDVLLYLIGTEGARSLFGNDSAASIIAVLGASANENVVSAVIFFAAVLLNLYFLLGYGGIALNMVLDFVLFPFIVIKGNYDRSVFGKWITEILGCMAVPIIDAILIMLPSFLGILATESGGMDAFGIAVVQLLICYLIIPARTEARRKIGLPVNPLESSGFLAATALGMAAVRGIKNRYAESKAAKVGAKSDRENAQIEEDLAKLESEEAGVEKDSAFSRAAALASEGTMRSAEEMLKKNGQLLDGGENKESTEDMPLGKEQTYAEGLREHLRSEGVDVDEETLSSEEFQEGLRENEGKLNELENKRKEKEKERSLIEGDQSLSDAERSEKLAKVDGELENLDKQMEDLSVDGKLRAAIKRKNELEAAYEEVSASPDMDEKVKNHRLDALNDQINSVDNEISILQKEKRKQELHAEMVDLAKEPATLRSEKAKLQMAAENIGNDRQQLVRERASLVSKQGECEVGSAEYRDIGQKINVINSKIAAKDMELGANQVRQSAIDATLSKQERGLRDRQAYNLHERVRAQESFDLAKAKAADVRNQLKNGATFMSGNEKKQLEEQLREAEGDMGKAQSRIGALAAEDRRIAARLHEISPRLNQVSEKELHAAKGEQKVKRAAIQREIAGLNVQMEMNPEGRDFYKEKIAKLRSEVADCDYKSARIDQMLDEIRVSEAGASGAKGNANAISKEYDRKRSAIMERYANIDNFERPEFSNISHEKRAQLYRERALRVPKVLFQRRLSAAAGAVVGASTGIWLGGPGIGVGGALGSVIGGEIGESMAVRRLERKASRETTYEEPFEFHISSDVRDNTMSGQVRTVERIQAELVGSLESDKFQRAVQDELMDTDIVQKQIRVLFRENQVTPQNYEAKRDFLLAKLRPQIEETISKAELRIVRQCAGQEYASLSSEVQRQIVGRVAKPNMEIFEELAEQYLGETWQPYYHDYL